MLVPYASGTTLTQTHKAKLFRNRMKCNGFFIFVNGFCCIYRSLQLGWTSSTVINCFLHFFCCLSIHSYRYTHLRLWVGVLAAPCADTFNTLFFSLYDSARFFQFYLHSHSFTNWTKRKLWRWIVQQSVRYFCDFYLRHFMLNQLHVDGG